MEITEIKRWISSRKRDSRTVFFNWMFTLDVYMGMFTKLAVLNGKKNVESHSTTS